MGISSAMYSGVSGLNTNGQAMSVIGNNLANTNTIGFKGSRTGLCRPAFRIDQRLRRPVPGGSRGRHV